MGPAGDPRAEPTVGLLTTPERPLRPPGSTVTHGTSPAPPGAPVIPFMLLLSHPVGPNPHVAQATRALLEAGLVGEAWTCFAPAGPRSRHRPGSQVPSPGPHLGTPPLAWFAPALAPGRALRHLLRGQRRWWDQERLRRRLDLWASQRLRHRTFSGVYGFAGCADQLFRAARERGLICFYDLPAGCRRFARAIWAEEAERSPDWAPTLRPTAEAERRLARRDRELAAADVVLVATSFALQTVEADAHFAGAGIVLPHGVDAHRAPAPSAGPPLRVLYVGPLGQRQGLRYLLEACARFPRQVLLTLIGRTPPESCAPLEAALRRHRLITPVGEDQLRGEMASHHVLVRPALADGSSGLLLEALAAGLPVIATPHTAAPDLIEDGVQGFIVPLRSSAGIAEKLDLLLREPERRRAMSAAAQALARSHSWEAYRTTLAACVSSTLGALA